MNVADSVWIGRLVGVAVLLAIVALLWLSRRLEKAGILKNYSRGLGRGLFEIEKMLRPSRQYVRDAKDKQKRVEDDDGGPPDPS
jgi:CRISPR/Cas system CSM-associated protein Csm3 (group 7 of RAMP superfamily)